MLITHLDAADEETFSRRISLRTLGVAARCDAFVQINRNIRTWHPEWEAAQLLFVRAPHSSSAQGASAATAAVCGSEAAKQCNVLHLYLVISQRTAVLGQHIVYQFTPAFLPEHSVPQWVV